MARKFDLISELYERTCFAVTDNPVNWQSFLKTAGRNFRLRFDEQLLIYAQRPDATAVLEIERWNGTFGRWVNPKGVYWIKPNTLPLLWISYDFSLFKRNKGKAPVVFPVCG